jgi:glycosyltransferase involved in cell wall biosynthesis
MKRLLFISRTSLTPVVKGGAELATFEMLSGLRNKGWEIEVIEGDLGYYSPRSWLGRARTRIVEAIFKRFRFLEFVFYPLFKLPWKKSYYSLHGDTPVDVVKWTGPTLHGIFLRFYTERLRVFKPDIVFTFDVALGRMNTDLVEMALELHIKAYMWIHCSYIFECKMYGDLKKIPIICNSNFSEKLLLSHGINLRACFAPVFSIEPPEIFGQTGRFITFCNPVEAKGVAIAIAMAKKMPKARFLFVRGRWDRIDYQEQNAFIREISALPNAELWDFQDDITKVLSETAVLLYPSQTLETFGRTVIEAQRLGIPVIVSDSGGLSDTVGVGGIVVKPKDDVDKFVQLTQRLLDDPVFRDETIQKGRENCLREEFNPVHSLARLDEFLSRELGELE